MDVSFENRYVPDERMLRAYTWRISTPRMVAVDLCILALLIAVRILFSAEEVTETIMYAWVVAGVSTSTLMPFLSASQLIKSRRAIHGGTNPETVVRFGAEIERIEGKSSLTLDYAQIRAFHKT